MKIIILLGRILLGLLFVVFGSNAFLHFSPMPDMKGPAADFIGSMNTTGYLQATAALQILGGGLLLFGRFAPLGLTVLGPIVVNIVLYHLFMERSGMPIALITALIWLFLFWAYRDVFWPILRGTITPSGGR